jgi:hypothetical protein
MALRYPVVVRREQKRRLEILDRHAPALAQKVREGKLPADRAIKQLAAELARKRAA